MKKLPKDELNSRFDTFLVLVLVGCLPFLMGQKLLTLIVQKESTSTIQWIVFGISLVVFIYTAFCYWTENNLNTIETKFSKKQNRLILLALLNELKWKRNSDRNNVIWVETKAHRIILVFDEKQISYNIRNIGGRRGRFPFLLGYDTFVTLKLKKKLNRLLEETTF